MRHYKREILFKGPEFEVGDVVHCHIPNSLPCTVESVRWDPDCGQWAYGVRFCETSWRASFQESELSMEPARAKL